VSQPSQSGSVVIVRDGLERVKMVFVVRIEDSSSIIDGRVVRLGIVLGEFLVRKINIELKIILRSG
jgi:hypothetical protein